MFYWQLASRLHSLLICLQQNAPWMMPSKVSRSRYENAMMHHAKCTEWRWIEKLTVDGNFGGTPQDTRE
jgi:hypothetical protein